MSTFGAGHALPRPVPRGTEVLVEVTHCGLCHSDLHVWEGFFELGNGRQVHRGIVADGGVRTAARLDAYDPPGGQGLVAHQEFGVFPGVNVVGHHRQLVALAQRPTQRERERRLAGSHRTADAHSQRRPSMCMYHLRT